LVLTRRDRPKPDLGITCHAAVWPVEGNFRSCAAIVGSANSQFADELDLAFCEINDRFLDTAPAAKRTIGGMQPFAASVKRSRSLVKS
jgi:hypothetical protein